LVVGRERKRYTLLRTKESWPNSMREMELRVGSRRRLKVAESAWQGGQDPCSIGCEKGKFIYKKERGDNEEDKRWKSVVLITFLLILNVAVKNG
jgi:hypothetical protein